MRKLVLVFVMMSVLVLAACTNTDDEFNLDATITVYLIVSENSLFKELSGR